MKGYQQQEEDFQNQLSHNLNVFVPRNVDLKSYHYMNNQSIGIVKVLGSIIEVIETQSTGHN